MPLDRSPALERGDRYDRRLKRVLDQLLLRQREAHMLQELWATVIDDLSPVGFVITLQ